jgi:hypothetical protein
VYSELCASAAPCSVLHACRDKSAYTFTYNLLLRHEQACRGTNAHAPIPLATVYGGLTAHGLTAKRWSRRRPASAPQQVLPRLSSLSLVVVVRRRWWCAQDRAPLAPPLPRTLALPACLARQWTQASTTPEGAMDRERREKPTRRLGMGSSPVEVPIVPKGPRGATTPEPPYARTRGALQRAPCLMRDKVQPFFGISRCAGA